MDLCQLENPGLEQKFQTYEGRVVLQGDVVKDDSGSYAVFKEQGSSASQITAAMFWTLSPDYLDALNKQLTQYLHTPKLRWKTLQHYLSFPSQSLLIYGNAYHVTSEQRIGKISKNLLFFSNEIFMVTHLPTHCGKDNWKRVCLKTDRKKHQPVNVCLYIASKVYSYLYMRTTSKWQGRNRNVSLCETKWWTLLILRNRRRSWIKYTWDVLNASACRTLILLMNTARCSSHEFLQDQLISCQILGKRTEKVIAWSYDMAGHGQKCFERYCELTNKNIEQLYKVSTPYIDDYQFK